MSKPEVLSPNSDPPSFADGKSTDITHNKKSTQGKVLDAGPSFIDAVSSIITKQKGQDDSNSIKSNSNRKQTVPIASHGVMSAAVSGAASMLSLQLFSKLITFVCNQLVLHHVAPEIFGVASIQLELLVATLLFLAREPIRLAVLRIPVLDNQGKPNLETLQRLINVSWLPSLVGGPLAAAMTTYYLNYMVIDAPGYTLAVKMYALGGMLDLLSEPFFTVCFALMRFKSRAAVEGAALTVQCFVTLLLLTWSSGDNAFGSGITAFGLSRIAFGATFLFGFIVAYLAALGSGIHISIIVPRRITVKVKENKRTFLFDPEILAVAMSFLRQSLVKHVLTEGDKIILSMFYTPYHQGVYAVIFNYGSTIVRIVFWPMEEAARLLFSRMPAPERHTKGRALLELVIKFHLTLGLFAIVFGTQYSRSFLLVLAGDQWGQSDAGWAGAPTALAAYCWFIPVLGINGIKEAYVTSVASPDDLANQSWWLVIGAGVFAGSAFLAYPLGATGLVIANALHLLVRIFWSFKFIRKSVGERSVSEQMARLRLGMGISWSDSVIPQRGVMYGMALVYLIAGWTRGAYFGREGYTEQYAALQHLAVGVGIASMALFLLIVKDLHFVLALWDLVFRGQIAV